MTRTRPLPLLLLLLMTPSALAVSPALAQRGPGAPRTPGDRGVRGAEVPDVWLATPEGFQGWSVQSVNCMEAVGEASVCSIEARFDGGDLHAEDLIGERATVGVRAGHPGERVVNGFITAAQVREVAGPSGPARVVHLELQTVLALMARGVRYAIHESASPLDVLRATFARYPQAPLAIRVRRRIAPRPIVVQHEESDLELVRRMVEEEGLALFVEHGRHGHTVVITDALRPRGGVQDVSYGESEEVTHLDRPEAVSVTEVVVVSPRADRAGEVLRARAARPRATAFGPIPTVVRDLHLGSERAARRRAEALLAWSDRSALRTAAFSRGTPEILDAVRLRGHPEPGENQVYRAISTSWMVDLYGHQAGEPIPIRGTVTLVPASLPHPSHVGFPRRLPGVHRVRVVGAPGADGRVRVRFAWAPDGSGDLPEASVPVHGVAPALGSAGLVMFEEGHPDRPILIGAAPSAP